MGMTYELYWRGDPTLVKDYAKAFNIQKEQENERLWLQGLYNFNAFSTAISNIHFGKGDFKPNRYLSKPFDFGEKTKAEKKKEVATARQNLVDNLSRWKQLWDQNKKG